MRGGIETVPPEFGIKLPEFYLHYLTILMGGSDTRNTADQHIPGSRT